MPMLDEILKKELQYDTLSDVTMSDVTREELSVKKILMPISDPINREQLRVMREMGKSVFELRLSKLLEGQKPTGFDKELMEAVMKMEELYVSFLSSELVMRNGKLVCKVNQDVIIHGKKLSPGDITLLDFHEAILLSITNYITPCSLFKSDNDEGSKEP